MNRPEVKILIETRVYSFVFTQIFETKKKKDIFSKVKNDSFEMFDEKIQFI
jgi:hypothetical protein